MADQKISELTTLTGANVADDDAIAIVDTSATETKKIVFSELKTALDTATGFVRITGDTMTGNLSMGDNVKAIFGAGSDLQIYHTGTNSVIDNNTGHIYIRNNVDNDDGSNIYIQGKSGENSIVINDDSNVELYFDNALKLATTSTGIDVTGTVTADGLTVDNAGTIQLTKNTTAAGDSLGIIEFHDEDGSATADAGKFQLQAFRGGDKDAPDFKLIGSDSTGVLRDRILVEDNGDISFYEDTGTTAKFLWDANAERLGIGTNSPTSILHVKGRTLAVDGAAASDSPRLNLDLDGTNKASVLLNRVSESLQLTVVGSNDITFTTNSAERMRIDSSGNVGIGGSPNRLLHVRDDNNFGGGSRIVAALTPSLSSTGNETAGLAFGTYSDDDYWKQGIFWERTGNNGVGNLIFANRGTADTTTVSKADAVMTLDASGNLLVGTTDNQPWDNSGTSTGAVLRSDGLISSATNGQSAIELNRLSSDGNIANFRRSGALVGSIGSEGGDALYIQSGTTSGTGLLFASNSTAIRPARNGVTVHNTLDLGSDTRSFKDLYLSGGVYLGGTAATNKLDDYEDGSWTVNLYKGGSALAVTSRYGYYRRVGDLLHISFYWLNSSITTTGTSVYSIQGMPFNLIALANGAYQFCPVGYNSIDSNNVHRWQANSSTELQMYGAGGATNVSSGLLEFSGAGVFRI